MSANTVVIGGIHHVTAIAADPQRNLDFYAGALGLRLVKRTVPRRSVGDRVKYGGSRRRRLTRCFW